MGRILRLGHTSATLAQSEAIAETLDFLSGSDTILDELRVKETAEMMRKLTYRKVTPRDTAFLVKMTALLEARERVFRDRWIKRALPPAFTGAAFWFGRMIFGDRADLFFRGVLLLSFAAIPIFYFMFLRKTGTLREAGERYTEMILWNFSAFTIGGALFMYDSVMRANPHLFPFAIGAVPSLVFGFSREFWKISKNNLAILEACDFYSDEGPPRASPF
jgi:hypothetical protein